MADTSQREKIIAKIAEMRMIDDTFMSAVFDGRKEETALLLSIVLGRDNITVVSADTQVYISNIYGREVRLDVLARDENGNAFNVEVQRASAGASPQRARFNGAMVDSRLLKKGEDFEVIPDRYVIFIAETDVYHQGIPAYHAQYTVKELDNAPLGDGSYIIYINGQYRNLETPIGQLMHDFFCDNAADILNPLLRERVRYLKDTEGGRQEVCKIVENLITEEKIELAKKAIIRGKISLEEIAETLGLPLAFVEELARQKSA